LAEKKVRRSFLLRVFESQFSI